MKVKIRREQFRVAFGLSDKIDERLNITLLYYLEADAADVLLTINIATQHRNKYQKVLEKFDDFFVLLKKKRNFWKGKIQQT